MKNFIILTSIVLISLLGCKPESNIISPDDSSTLKVKQLVKLPAPKSKLSVETLYTQSKYINGNNGGAFGAQFEYQSTEGNITITSQLVFPAGAFSSGKTITQTFNTETASLEFGPAMQFNNAVKYTLTVSGLDLTGINPATLDFVYVASDGSITGVQYDSITMDASTGSLKVTNARLEHFSRYGFVN